MKEILRLKLAAILVSALIVAVSGVVNAQEVQETNAREADILRLQEWVLIERSLHPHTARKALMQLEGIRRNKSLVLSDAEFYLTVAGTTAMADNGHSNTSLSPIYNDFGVAPLRAYWFDEGLYITRADKAYSALVGGRIAALEGLSVEEVLDKIDPYHGGTRGFLMAYTALPFMMSLPLLEAMDVVRDGKLTLSVVTTQGKQIEVDFGPDDMSKTVGRVWPWERLVPGKENDSHDWVNAEPAGEALWLSASDQRFQFKRLQEDIAYIQFRGNFSAPNEDIGDFLKDVVDELKANPPRAIILDNRANFGGDLTLTADFGLGLPGLLQDGGRIYSLTGNATFSAGIYNALTPKAVAPAHTIVLGEVVGDRPVFWAESWNDIQLQQSGWYLNYALQKHDVGAGCNDDTVCHLAGRGPMNIAVGTIEPEHKVSMMFADYMSGRDPVLEKALILIGE
jgi:hypothetical protein